MFVAAAANYAIYYTQIDQALKNSETDDVLYELSCLYSTCPSEKSNLGKWYQDSSGFDLTFSLISVLPCILKIVFQSYDFCDNNDIRNKQPLNDSKKAEQNCRLSQYSPHKKFYNLMWLNIVPINSSMLFDEVVGTFILEVSALAVTDPKNAFPPGMGPYLVGLSATAMGLAFGPNSG